jgi:DNA-binding GntR family transcriptional regulator
VVKRAGGESLAVDVYERLRADIYDRRLAPGERLKPAQLGGRFGVSIGVMREALGLLAAQQLVRWERNRGYHVVTLSPAALADLIEARKISEGAALRLSIARGGVMWESEVLAAHHRMASLPTYLIDDPTARNPEWAKAHIAFHLKLIEACGNEVLMDVCIRLSDAAELYRAWSGVGGTPHRDVAAEHRALMEAALAHDEERAVRLFEDHVERTRTIVLDLERGALSPLPSNGEPQPAR